MELKKFWNKAIEFYCTYNSTDKRFDTVFIAIAEESLERIKEKYIHNGSFSDVVVSTIERNIENIGGISKSYYYSIREVHKDLSKPAEYSFLRFSILVVGAFKQDDRPLRNYWGDFDTFLREKVISTIPAQQRSNYLKNIFENLTKYCLINHNKTFFQLNVFGDNHALVNVGKIKAHSIFQGSTLKKIKKSIYNLGYSDSHNIDDLTYNDIEEILKDSGLDRILELFRREDNDTKEIVFVCLKIWLQNWIPEQKEKVDLLEGRTSDVKPKLQIHRIWIVNGNNNIEIKFGFFLKSNLGEDNVFYLNKNKNIYVDVAWGIKINENRTLYIIENYVDNEDLNSNELVLNFKAISNIFLDKNEYALEKVPNRMYFIEQNEDCVTIKDNPVLLASKVELNDENIEFFHNCSIENQQELNFNLYRIKDSIRYNRFSFIKTSNLNIYPIGISDGRQGVKSYLSTFPIKIKYNNLSNGEIHIYYNNEIKKSIILSEASIKLDCEENIGRLASGNYSIKYFKERYENFPNGNDSIDFKIVESGIGDGRSELSINTIPTFEYHEFRRLKEINNIEDSFLILYDFNSNLKVEDKHTFFYFVKNNRDEWEIKPNEQCFFIQRLRKKPNNFEEIYFRYQKDFKYLSKNFVQYDYKVSFCERPKFIDLSFNLDDFYQRNEECRINTKVITTYCYYFRLEYLDDRLKKKYPSVKVGDVICVLSNKYDFQSENLIKLLNQEAFPFKKIK
jgi:hypothetical protein